MTSGGGLQPLADAPCVFTPRRNSSFSRSMTLAVRKVLHCAFGQALTHAEDGMPSHSKPLARLGRYPVAAERATGRKPRSYGRLTDPSTNPVGTTIVVASSTFLRRVIPSR